MKTATENPIQIKTGYGTVGMKLELSLAQMQELGLIYHQLKDRESVEDNLSVEEALVMPFLEIFKNYSLDSKNIWSNFKAQGESYERIEVK